MVLFLHIFWLQICKTNLQKPKFGKKSWESFALNSDQLKSLLQYICEKGRICPQQNKWHELWEMLPDKNGGGGYWRPPLPLIFDKWDNTTDHEKMLRLKQHIQYAAEKDLLDRIEKFIKGLTRDDWHTL
jgi:hypothetical protein